MSSEQTEQSLSNNHITAIFTEKDNGFQAKKYFFTYHLQNNETFELIFNKLEDLKILCDKYIWSEEYGKSKSTPHIQGAFILKSKMRANTINKHFFNNKCHLVKIKKLVRCI